MYLHTHNYVWGTNNRRTYTRPHGRSPARAIARMNYGLLPLAKMQHRTIARRHTNALLAFCIVNSTHSCHKTYYRMCVKYAKVHLLDSFFVSMRITLKILHTGMPNIRQNNPRWRRRPFWIFAQTAITQPPIDVDE